MTQEIIRIDLGGVNCYLGKEGDSFILFDTGGHIVMDKVFNDRCDILSKELDKVGCTTENLKLIVLTHGDNDHTANAAFLRQRYNARIAMNSSDVELVETPTLEKALESFRYRSIVLKLVFRLMKKAITKVTVKTLEDFKKFKPDIYLKDGDSLSEYGFNAKVLHIPGHTDGSIGVLTSKGDFIAGDTFVNVKKPSVAPNANNFETLFDSVKRLKAMNIKTVYPGHGTPFEMNQLA